MNVLVVVSKHLQAGKLCSNDILQFLTGLSVFWLMQMSLCLMRDKNGRWCDDVIVVTSAGCGGVITVFTAMCLPVC